ncbi:MAG TPA: histidine kinase [Anaeromyxobacter sp.]|nr:histidine kinase [Anaeromyxobacter sp.]
MVTISRRFSVAFILIVAVPSLVVSVVLSRLYQSALYRTVARQTEVTAEQVAHNIRAETDDVAILAAALIHDAQLRELADSYAAAADRKLQYLAARRLDEKLVSFFNYTKRVGAVVVFMRDGASYSYSNYPNIRGLAGIDRTVYAPAAADPGKVYLFDSLEAVTRNVGERNVISLAVCPDRGDETAIEAILVMFRVPDLDALAARWEEEAGAAVVIFGRSGKPILSTMPGGTRGDAPGELARILFGGGADRSARELRAGGRAWLATLYPMSSTGWTVVLLADKAALLTRVTRYQWYLYPALALLAVLFVLYAEVFFARIAGPVRAVVAHMGRVGKGDYAVRAARQSIAELAELSQGFNAMVQQIEQLLAERARIERERLAAELDALRYQINPHFVVNTLNSIRLMAVAARAEAIAGMTRDLMRVLSDSYSGAEKLTELSREIENVQAYVGIMKVRFGELFAVKYDLEPGTESLLTLRMVLQPIVENSILHGFSGGSSGGLPRGGRGTIRVSARLEARELPAAAWPEEWAEPVAGQVLVVEVRDDGSGIEPDQAAGILEGKAEQGGLYRIGVPNVHRRIRLNFGEPFGLEVESEPGAYTLVRYLLPALVRRASEALHA